MVPAEDFQLLRKQGIALIEQLASSRWTDYNTHDPGITMLEALCYAITDIGYRTGFELKDLLTRSAQGANYAVGRFHTAAEILQCYPVNFDDLRKLLIDIRGVRNAFVHPVDTPGYGPNDKGCLSDTPASGAFSLKGLFEVCLEFEENVLELRTGPADLSALQPGQGNFITPEGQGIRFRPQRNLWLKSVAMYPANPGNITLKLTGPGGEVLHTWNRNLPLENEKNIVSLGALITFDPKHENNVFTLSVEGQEGCPWLFAHHEPHFPIQLPGYVSLLGGDPEADTNYFFYDWEWDTPPYDTLQEVWHKGRVGEPDYSTYPSDYVKPEGHSMVFDVETELTLDAVYIFVNKKGNVAISLLDESDKEIYRHELVVNDTLCKLKVPLCWEIPACQGYKLVAVSDKGVELVLNPEAAFPYFIDGVVYLLGESDEEKITQQYAFFYDWEISWKTFPSESTADNQLTKGSIIREAWRKIHAHRNLCEDLAGIDEVTTEEVGIQATFYLTSDADVDLVMATAHSVLETYVKPPVFFYSLQQMQEKGYTTDEIFEGPLLAHGFIDPEEFKAAKDRTELRASDILNLLMDIPGVKTIKGLRMESWKEGVMTQSKPWLLCLDAATCRVPNYAPERACLSFYRDGIALRTDSRRVQDFLEELQLTTTTIRLRGHDTDLPVPIGEDRQVGDYDPIQHELPGIYQAGRYLTPEGRPTLRKAQARQLKAYLQFFEQILANYLAQLDQFPQLLNWDSKDVIRTYFTQEATQDIEEVEKIYVRYDDLNADLHRIIEGDSEALNRRNRFLEHLIGRFSESFTDYSLLMYHLFNRDDQTALRVVRDKEAFLRHYPALSARRGQGLDYRSSASPLMGGFQQRVMALMGMRTGQMPPYSLPYQLRHDATRGWQLVIMGTNEWGDQEVWFESRFTEGADTAEGLFALIRMFGGETENYRLASIATPACTEDNWELQGPCTDEGSTPLGRIPFSDPAIRDQMSAWLKAWTAPTPPAPEPDTAWPDLASDAFELIESEGINYFFVVKGAEGQVLFKSTPCESQAAIEQLLDAATAWGADMIHYRLEADTCQWVLEKPCEGAETSVFGRVLYLEYLQAVVDAFQSAYLTEGMHLIEHLLLRPRHTGGPFLHLNTDPESPITAEPDPYSFQATAILPAWSTRSLRLPFRKMVEDTLRREAPAHVFLHIYWLNYTQMQRFERAYRAWMAELSVLPEAWNGAKPFPVPAEIDPGNIDAFDEKLAELLQTMACFQSVYPPARTYDPDHTVRGEEPMLGRMSLKAM